VSEAGISAPAAAPRALRRAREAAQRAHLGVALRGPGARAACDARLNGDSGARRSSGGGEEEAAAAAPHARGLRAGVAPRCGGERARGVFSRLDIVSGRIAGGNAARETATFENLRPSCAMQGTSDERTVGCRVSERASAYRARRSGHQGAREAACGSVGAACSLDPSRAHLSP
jgi:hypothetical protein